MPPHMSTEQTHYDIFLSYSRADNVLLPGTNLRWVEAIKQRIEQDHERYSNQKLRFSLRDRSEAWMIGATASRAR